MLSRDAKAILRIAARKSEQSILYSEIQEAFSWDFGKASSVCQQLIEQGYAIEKHNHSPVGKTMTIGITLSEKGRNRKKYFWAGIAEFLLKSVAIPILVAFLTALITAIVTTKVTLG